jgi:hypothetical protein
MSSALPREPADRSAIAFAGVCALVIAAAGLLAGYAPLGFSIATVFLFAGPHNWLELRYFMTQMPARWGPLRMFFIIGIGGVLMLTSAFIAIPIVARQMALSYDTIGYLSSAWLSAVALWIAWLLHLRAGQHPKKDFWWAWPIALLVVSGVWYRAWAFEIALVYLHPMIAMLFCYNVIRRKRPGWLAAYRIGLLLAAGGLGVIWWRLWDAPALPGDDMLSMRITANAGAEWLTAVSSHALVASHTFLELLHYGIWVVLIPLITMRAMPWKLANVPLARRGGAFRWTIIGLCVAGLAVVIALWAGFIANYPLTRDLYFTIAIAHVLAEAPFLIRTL